jgi:CHAT domain-containing protein
LPLHAAGIYQGRDQENLSEYAVSSYIPTLTALFSAQAGVLDSADQSSRILLLAPPGSVGLPELPHARVEADVIERTVPADSLLEGSGIDKTISSVLDRIPRANVVHFACHGRQINADPLKSGFELSDGRLTLTHLMRLHIPDGQLAYLSACESAAADVNQPDEAVNIATAMLYVGFKSIIATLW